MEPYGLALLLLALGLVFARISPRTFWQRIWLLVLLMAIGAWPIATSKDETYHTILALGPLGTSYGALRSLLLLVGCVGLVLLVAMYLLRLGWPVLWQRRSLRYAKGLIWLLTLACFLLYWLYSGPPASQHLPIGPVEFTDMGVWALITF